MSTSTKYFALGFLAGFVGPRILATLSAKASS